MSKKVTRLYEQYAPEHYEIHLKISQDKKTFTGSVTINGQKVGRPSKRITLHQKGLKTSNHVVVHTDKRSGERKTLDITRTVDQNSYDELRLHFDTDIYPGRYEISMDFSGKITKNMDGVYPCFFEDDGAKKELVATQFESHHAREAFPCIDEPEAKATFQLHVTYAKDEVALSNTNVTDEKVQGQSKTTTFDTTPIMSTYLLAFVVGDIQYKEATSANGVKIRTYAVPNQVAHTDFALDIAVKCMDFYEEYFDIPFPLEKCDFVALPDFASGAMENWGLITFREQAMLYDEAHASLSAKQWVALVVAHELTHQWFGNLVTMRWWTDLWLNEGFASWMEYLAVDHIFPEWHLWTQFAVDEQGPALKLDALEHTHPIEVPVKHPDEIRTIFDAISYQKGASVIHMLHDYLGADKFKEGIQSYLKKYAYKNTDTIDLWQSFEDATGKPVKDFMHVWTSESGFPLVSIAYDNDHAVVTQKRFFSNPQSTASDNTLWPIPLLAPSMPVNQASKQKTNIPVSMDNMPIKINQEQRGFYRVNYSHELQQRQLAALDKGTLSDTDRMGLLSDSFETTKAGYQPVSEFLELLEHFRNEESLPVWEMISASVGSIRSTLSKDDRDDSLRDLINPYIQTLVSKQLTRLGWEAAQDESHLDALLRPLIIGLAATADHPETVAACKDAYKLKTDKNQEPDPNLRATIYATVARTGGAEAYEQMLDMYKASKSSNEKLALTAAMTSFKQQEIHKEVLELIKTDTVKLQDTSYWLAYSFMNRYSRQTTWQWLQDNWQWLKEHNGSDLSFFRTPMYAARCFADEKFMKSYKSFFTGVMEPSIERTYNQGLEVLETAVAWRKRDSQTALDWFTQAQ